MLPKLWPEDSRYIIQNVLKMITVGIPAWRASSAAAKAVKGVSSEGFMTTVQPHARAGPTWLKFKLETGHVCNFEK